MDRFFRLVNTLPKDQKDIFYKYMGVVAACQKDLEEKMNFVEQHGLKIDTARALVRVFSMDIKDLKQKYSLFAAAAKEIHKEEEILHMIKVFPEILRYDHKKVLARIVACSQMDDKPILVGDKPAGYIIDDMQWQNLLDKELERQQQDEDAMRFYNEALEKGNVDDANYENIMERPVDPQIWITPDYEEDKNYDMNDVKAFERYQSLLELVGSIRSAIGSTAQSIEGDLIIPDILMKELSTNPLKSDKEIVKTCLEAIGVDLAPNGEDLDALISEMTSDRLKR